MSKIILFSSGFCLLQASLEALYRFFPAQDVEKLGYTAWGYLLAGKSNAGWPHEGAHLDAGVSNTWLQLVIDAFWSPFLYSIDNIHHYWQNFCCLGRIYLVALVVKEVSVVVRQCLEETSLSWNLIVAADTGPEKRC